jgi:hypothetical protein
MYVLFCFVLNIILKISPITKVIGDIAIETIDASRWRGLYYLFFSIILFITATDSVHDLKVIRGFNKESE